MKCHGVLVLVGVAGFALTGFGQAQIAGSSRFRFPQRQLHRLGRQTSTLLRAQQSLLPATAAPDVILAQCPAEAIGLDPAVRCGYLPVPMHRDRPEKTEKIKIYFDAESAFG